MNIELRWARAASAFKYLKRLVSMKRWAQQHDDPKMHNQIASEIPFWTNATLQEFYELMQAYRHAPPVTSVFLNFDRPVPVTREVRVKIIGEGISLVVDDGSNTYTKLPLSKRTDKWKEEWRASGTTSVMRSVNVVGNKIEEVLIEEWDKHNALATETQEYQPEGE